MSETNATKTLRTHLQSGGAHCQRFEDKLTPGIPDTGCGKNGVYAFLEGKFIKALPARDTTNVMFGSKGEPRLAHQCNWLTAHDKAGGLAFWWVRVRDGGWYLFTDRYTLLRDGFRKDLFLQEKDWGSAKAMAEEINNLMLDQAARI
tara:strand:- start:63 stop:503 length:441 start_codon:yes stop_codon:yes gene_type:complete